MIIAPGDLTVNGLGFNKGLQILYRLFQKINNLQALNTYKDDHNGHYIVAVFI